MAKCLTIVTRAFGVRRLWLLLVFTLVLGVLASSQNQNHTVTAVASDRTVIYVPGLTSEAASANNVRQALQQELSNDVANVWIASYWTQVSNSEASYTKLDTCIGNDKIFENLDALLAAAPGDVDLIGHSQGGFVAALYTSNLGSIDRQRIRSVITLDSPLDLGATPNWALNGVFHCDIFPNAENPDTHLHPGANNQASYDELTSASNQDAIRSLSSTVPIVALDCNGVWPLPPCLQKLLDLNVNTDVDGSWRHFTTAAPNHTQMPTYSETLTQITSAIQTELIEVGQAATGYSCPVDNWSSDPNGDYVEGLACKTKETSSSFQITVPDADRISVVYRGDMSVPVTVSPPTGIPFTLDESTCARFQYHQGGIKLCQTYLGGFLSAGPHTLTFNTRESCTFVVNCDWFFLDAVEYVPRGTSSSGNTIDTALIIDSSGSMGGNDPSNKRLEAAKAYLTVSLGGDFVGVIDFDSGARVASPLVRYPDNRASLLAAINSINSSGGTNIGGGIQTACNALIASTSGNATKAAILLTDGQGSFSGQDSCFSGNNWPIYTFGFGSANDSLLQQIASNTGGEFARLPTSNLVCEFQGVRAKISGNTPESCTPNNVLPAQTTSLAAIIPPDQAQATFSSSWLPPGSAGSTAGSAGSNVVMSLKLPSGRIIDANTVAPDVFHDLGEAFESFSVLLPEDGAWQINLYGANVPTAGLETVFNFITLPRPPDETPPVTNAAVDPDSAIVSAAGVDEDDGPPGGTVNVTLEALDPDLGDTSIISGVASTHYQVDDGSAQPYSSPFDVNGAGEHVVTFWSVDVAGNQEFPQAIRLEVSGLPSIPPIDWHPPDFGITPIPTPTASSTPTSTHTPTSTPTATPTDTPTPTITATPAATSTPTFTPTATAAPPCSVTGDASMDGIVNTVDAELLLQYVAALVGSLPCMGAADVNGDGAMNGLDAALVLQYDAGLITSLPPPGFTGQSQAARTRPRLSSVW